MGYGSTTTPPPGTPPASSLHPAVPLPEDQQRQPDRSQHLLVATDTNTVAHDQVTGNDSFGIGVGNFCVVTHLPPLLCGLLDIDPDSDANQVLHNSATGNGLAPDPAIAPLPGADLLWDGTGTGNCRQDNTADTTFPTPLPTCS